MADRLPAEDAEALEANVTLVGRTGARDLTFGHTDDAGTDWWAHAQYQGARITVEHQPGPLAALEALVIELLTGARCVRCQRLVQIREEGAYARPGRMVDGTEWTVEQIRAAGLCRWRRVGREWRKACAEGDPV